MTLQQLHYVLAVDAQRHFARAAEVSFISQPTLSMMIQKLEDELNLKIFDRNVQPVAPTEAGIAIIEQAKLIIQEVNKLKEVVNDMNSQLTGHIRLGIIPTVAPYLLPRFLFGFLRKYPQLKVSLIELTTEEVLGRLKHHKLDAAILATPIANEKLQELPLYYEPFVVYASGNNEMMRKKLLLPGDLDTSKLWLLEEGHCMRGQVLNLCELRKKDISSGSLEYEAGSIETLKRMVDANAGITILPALALDGLTSDELKRVKKFKSPVPARQISIITYEGFVKHRIINALREEIRKVIPLPMLTGNDTSIMSF